MTNCKYLKQKFNRTLECKKQKKTINIKECNGCEFKEDKVPKAQSRSLNHNKMQDFSNVRLTKKRNKPSKRTKALAISKQVKLIVWERDNHKCIFCGREVPWNFANSHFIKRSHGGLGIPENVFCACLECHHNFDDTPNRIWMLPIARDYLINNYKKWKEDDLVYKK